MPETSVELTAPNGVKIDQPVGLFINNDFVKSSTGEKFATIDPAYVNTLKGTQVTSGALTSIGLSKISQVSMLPALKM